MGSLLKVIGYFYVSTFTRQNAGTGRIAMTAGKQRLNPS